MRVRRRRLLSLLCWGLGDLLVGMAVLCAKEVLLSLEFSRCLFTFLELRWSIQVLLPTERSGRESGWMGGRNLLVLVGDASLASCATPSRMMCCRSYTRRSLTGRCGSSQWMYVALNQSRGRQLGW
eukprot:5019378-Amphidinium_carterae.2